MVVKIANAKEIVIARWDHAMPADAAADGPINRIGIFVGKTEPGEQTHTLHIRYAIESINRPVARLLGEQILPVAPVSRPSAVLRGDDNAPGPVEKSRGC